jgi:hypothetical protein
LRAYVKFKISSARLLDEELKHISFPQPLNKFSMFSMRDTYCSSRQRSGEPKMLGIESDHPPQRRREGLSMPTRSD